MFQTKTKKQWAAIAGFFFLAALFFSADCRKENSIRVFPEEPYPARLSDWRLFLSSPDGPVPSPDLRPYDLINSNFRNYAEVKRFFYIPDGGKMHYLEGRSIILPEGSLLAQTYFFINPKGKRKLMETRLLVRSSNGWTALPYQWNEDGTDAALTPGASRFDVDVRIGSVSRKIEYDMPGQNECNSCHQDGPTISPIAFRAELLNVTSAQGSQLDGWIKSGILTGLDSAKHAPRMSAWNAPQAKVEDRAKAYLEINCAHCHNPGGNAGYTGLHFNFSDRARSGFGLCKIPFSAGRGTGGHPFDIFPGNPARSIVLFRMQSNEPGIMMPQFGRTMVHREGVDLMRQWIASMRMLCPPGGVR